MSWLPRCCHIRGLCSGDEGTVPAVLEHPACHRQVLPQQRCFGGAGSKPLPGAEHNGTIALFLEVVTYKCSQPFQAGHGNVSVFADVTPRDGCW